MRRRTALRLFTGLAAVGVSGCLGNGRGGIGDGGDGDGDSGDPDATEDPGNPPSLASDAFGDGEAIPVRFTCDGEDVSPPLSIGDVPSGAGSLAIVVDDPDAPGRTFVHWLLWALSPSTGTVPEAVPREETVGVLDGATQGTNDAGRVGYSGPCPPPDDGPHTYRFRLLALAEPLDLPPGADRAAFDEAVSGVGRSSALLRGTYDR